MMNDFVLRLNVHHTAPTSYRLVVVHADLHWYNGGTHQNICGMQVSSKCTNSIDLKVSNLFANIDCNSSGVYLYEIKSLCGCTALIAFSWKIGKTNANWLCAHIHNIQIILLNYYLVCVNEFVLWSDGMYEIEFI